VSPEEKAIIRAEAIAKIKLPETVIISNSNSQIDLLLEEKEEKKSEWKLF